jgi:hypothetical protein
MGRLVWPLVLVVAFGVGWVAAGVARKPAPEAALTQETVSRLEQQVTTLKARLHARESLSTSRPSGATTPRGAPAESVVSAGTPAAGSLLSAAVTEGRAAAPQSGAVDRAPSGSAARGAAPPSTVEAALDRFYRYLEATNGTEGRERWRQVRELVDDLRSMGDVAAQALMNVLAAGNDSDERRAAARLLGTLQVPQSLPLLKDIIEKDDDVLLRRAAAAGLRQLQTPESIPVMEHVLATAGEDRMVRLSAAYGLAEAGRPTGVSGLAQIFQESTVDGRGREMAFRALASLNDERALPFMRQVVTADVEPAYRLRAIRYVATQGDQQALAGLRVVMSSPTEQPSIRDAAGQAYRVLGGR